MAEYTDLPFALVRPGHVWAAGIVLPVVCAILVSLRFYVRRSKKQRIGLEDWMSAIALVLVFGMGACLIVGVVQGVMGYPTPLPEGIDPQEAYRQSIENYEKIAKIQFYYQLIMIVAYGCIKVSLILFYRRLFVVTRWSPFDITCVAYLAFMVAWTLWLFLWFLWACRLDIDLHWAPLSEVEDRCGDPLAPEMALVISDLITDLMILALPLPVIWRLQLRWRRKVTLSLVFLVGLVAIAASIARMAIYIIVTYTGLDAGYDLNRTITTMLWWSMIEACLGLMTCCLPILSGLLRHLKIGGWIGGLYSRLSGSRSRTKPVSPDLGLEDVRQKKAHIVRLAALESGGRSDESRGSKGSEGLDDREEDRGESRTRLVRGEGV